MAKGKSNPIDPVFDLVKKDPGLIPLLATDENHANRLRSMYNTYAANQKLMDSGFSSIGTESSYIGDVPDDLDTYARLGVDYKPRYVEQSQRQRVDAQSKWEKFGRGLKRIPGDFFFQLAGSVGAILDVEDYINSPEEEEVGNWLTDWATRENQKMKQSNGFQIYNNPEAGMSDAGWWFENGSSLVSSVAAFAVPGMAIGKGLNAMKWLDKLTKLSKAGAIAEGGAEAAEAINKAGKGISWLDRMLDGSNIAKIKSAQGITNNTITNLALNQAESIMSATEIYKETYDDAVSRGVTDEEARKIAGTAAAYTVSTNRINMALNATSVGRFLKSPDAIKSAVKLRSWRIKDILKTPEGVESIWKDALVKEGLQEAGEELVNYYASEQGKGILNRVLLNGEDINVNENLFNLTKIPAILSGLGTKEGFESAFLGFLGGAGQTLATEGFNYIPGKVFGERVVKTDEQGRPIYKKVEVKYDKETPYEVGERVWDEVRLADGRVLKEGKEYTTQVDANGQEQLVEKSANYKVTDDDIINNADILKHKPTEVVKNKEGEVVTRSTGETEYEADGKYFSKANAMKKNWESMQKLNKVIESTSGKFMNAAYTAQRQAQDWSLIEAVDMLNDPNTDNDQRNMYHDIIARYELFREGKLTGDEVLDKKALEEKREEVKNLNTQDLVNKQNQARESVVSELAWNSFSTNSTETLLDTFNKITNLSPDEAAEQGFSEDYKEKALGAIADINKLKNVFIEYNSKYDPQTAKALFDNRAMDMFLYRERNRLNQDQSTLIGDISRKAQERSDRLSTIEGLDQARQINATENTELEPHRTKLSELNRKISEIRARKVAIDGASTDPLDIINSIERNEEAKRKEINELLKEKDKELAKIRDIRDKFNFQRREQDLLDNADIEAINRYDVLIQRQKERITNNDQLFVELRDKIKSQRLKEQAINYQRLREIRFAQFMETILELQEAGSHSPVFKVDEELTEADEHAKVLFSMLYEKYSKLVEAEKRTPGEINVLSDNPPITSKEEREKLLSEATTPEQTAALNRTFQLEDILYAEETTLSSQIAARIALGDESIQYSDALVKEVQDSITNVIKDKKQPRTPIEEKTEELYNNSVKEDDKAIGKREEKTVPTSIKDLERDIEDSIIEYTKLFNEYMTNRFNGLKSEVISKLKDRLKKLQKLSENQMFLEELLTSGLNGKVVKETKTVDGKEVAEYFFIPEMQSGMYIDESEKNFYEFATYPDNTDTKIYNVEATDVPGYYNVTLKDPEYRVKMNPDNSRQIEVYSKEQIEYKDNLENALKVIRNQANRIKKLRREKSKTLTDVTNNSDSIVSSLNALKDLMEEQIPGFKEFIEALEETRTSEAEEKAKKLAISEKEKQEKIDRLNKEREEKIASVPLVPVDNPEAVQEREELIQEINNEHNQKVKEVVSTQEEISDNKNISFYTSERIPGVSDYPINLIQVDGYTKIKVFIPREVARIAYNAYQGDYFPEEGGKPIQAFDSNHKAELISKNINVTAHGDVESRGGFSEGEMDRFYPDWKSHSSKIINNDEDSFSSNYPESFEETKEQQEASQLYSDILQFFNVLPKSLIDSKKSHLEKQITDLNLSKSQIELELKTNKEKLNDLINSKNEFEKQLLEKDSKRVQNKIKKELVKIEETISSIQKSNNTLRKNKSKVVTKLNTISKALPNYTILSEIATGNNLTVPELKTKMRNYNEELVSLRDSLGKTIEKNEEIVFQLKGLRNFYNSFFKQNQFQLKQVQEQILNETGKLGKTGYGYFDGVSKLVKRDFTAVSEYLNFFENLQHFTSSKKYSLFEYQTLLNKLESVVSFLDNESKENPDDISVSNALVHYKNLHTDLSTIIATPNKKVRARFIKAIASNIPVSRDGNLKEFLVEQMVFLNKEKENSLKALGIIESIEKLKTSESSYLSTADSIKTIIVDKANIISELNPSLEIGAVTSITKLNKIISSLNKRIYELEAQQTDVNNKYKAVSKDVDAFFSINVYKDLLDNRKSLKNALNDLEREFKKKSLGDEISPENSRLIGKIIAKRSSKDSSVDQTNVDDLSNPFLAIRQLINYLDDVDNIKFITEETDVDLTLDKQIEELKQSNENLTVKMNKEKTSIQFAYDEILASLENITNEKNRLQKELEAVEKLSTPTLEDLWVLRKMNKDQNPSESDGYYKQIEELENDIKNITSFVENNKNALQAWVKYLDINNKAKSTKSKELLEYLNQSEAELLESFGLAEQFKQSGATSIKDFINTTFKSILGISPELLNYDKILESDFSQITESENPFANNMSSIPKLELELKLLQEAYGDIAQIVVNEKQDRLKSGKKEIAELSKKFNDTHTPLNSELGVITNSENLDSLSGKEDNLSTDLSNLIIEQNLKPVGTLITSAYDIEYTLEDDTYQGIPIKVPTTVFDKDGVPKFTKNRQQRYWSILLNKIVGNSFTDEKGNKLPDPKNLRLRFVLANDKFIGNDQAYSDDVNPYQKEELKKRGLSVDESGKVFISNKNELNKFLTKESYGSYVNTSKETVDLVSDEDKTIIESLLKKDNGTKDDNKSRLTINEFDVLFKYKIADAYSKKQGDETVLHFTDEKYDKGTFIHGTGMYVTISDVDGKEYYFDLANNKFTNDKSKLNTGDYDKIVTTLVRPNSSKRMQLKNALATFIYKNMFTTSEHRMNWSVLSKILSDVGQNEVTFKYNNNTYTIPVSEIALMPDSFVLAKAKYDELSDTQKLLFEIAENLVVDNISNEYTGRRSIKQLLKANPDKVFISSSPLQITAGIPILHKDDALKNATGAADSAIPSAEDVDGYIVHTLGNKSTASSWGDSIGALFDNDPLIVPGKGKRGRVYLKKKNKAVIEAVTRKINEDEAQLIIDMFTTDYTGFVTQDSEGARTIREIRDEAGNRISDTTYLTMWPGNEFGKSMIQKLIFFQRKLADGAKRTSSTLVIGLDDSSQNAGSRKLYIYYGIDGKLALSDLKNQSANKDSVNKFKEWLKTRPLNLLNGIDPNKPYLHPVKIKRDVGGEPILVVKKFEPVSDTNKVHPYVGYMLNETNGQTVLQTNMVPDESYYKESERLQGKGQQTSNRYIIIDNGAISVDGNIKSDGTIPSVIAKTATEASIQPEETETALPVGVSKSIVINQLEDKVNNKIIKTIENTLSDDFIITDLKENVPYVITTKEVSPTGTKINAKITILRKGNDISIIDHNYNAVKVDGTVLNKEALDKIFKDVLYELTKTTLSLFVNTPNIIKSGISNNINDIDLSNIKKVVIEIVKKSFEQVKDHDFQFSMEITYQDKVTEDLPVSNEQQDINSGLFTTLSTIENKIDTTEDPLALMDLNTQLVNIANKGWKSTEFEKAYNTVLSKLTNKNKEVEEVISKINTPETKSTLVITESPITSVTDDIEKDRQSELKEKGFTKEGEPSLEYEIAETEADIRKIEEGLKRRKGENNEKLKKRLLAHKRYLDYLRENKTFDAAFDALQKDYEDNLPVVDETIPGSLEFAKNYSEEHQTVVELFKDRYKERNEIRDKYDARIKESKEKSTSVIPDKSVTFTLGSLADFLEHTGLRTQLEPLLAKVYTSWNTIPILIDPSGNFTAKAFDEVNRKTLGFDTKVVIGKNFQSEDKSASTRQLIHEVVHIVTLRKLGTYYNNPEKVSDKIKEGVQNLIQIRNEYLESLVKFPKKITEDFRFNYIFGYAPKEVGLDQSGFAKAIKNAMMRVSKEVEASGSEIDVNKIFDYIIEEIALKKPEISKEVLANFRKQLSENVTEFIAGIFENKALRTDLSSIQSSRSTDVLSLITDFINTLKTYFLSLGDSLSPGENTLLDEAIYNAESIIKDENPFINTIVEKTTSVETKPGLKLNSNAIIEDDDINISAGYPSNDEAEDLDFNSDLSDLFDVIYRDNYRGNSTLFDKHFELVKSLFNISPDTLFNLNESLKYFNDEKEITTEKDKINNLFNLLDALPIIKANNQGISKLFELLNDRPEFRDLSVKDKSLIFSEKIKEYLIYSSDANFDNIAEELDPIFADPSFKVIFGQIKELNSMFALNDNFVNEAYKTLQVPLPTSIKTNIMKYFHPGFVTKNDEEVDVPEIFVIEIMDALDYMIIKKLVSNEELAESLDLSLTNKTLSDLYQSSFNDILNILEKNKEGLISKNNPDLSDRINNLSYISDVLKVSKNRDALLASHISTRLNSILPKIDLEDSDIDDLMEGDETKDTVYEDTSERDVSESIPGVMKMILSSVPKKKKLVNKVKLEPEQEKRYNQILSELRLFRTKITEKKEKDVIEKGEKGRFIINKQGFTEFTTISSPHKLIKTFLEFIPVSEQNTISMLSSLLEAKYKNDEQKALSRDKNLEILINNTLDKVINRLDLLVTNKISSMNMVDDNSLLLSLPKLEDFKRVWNYIARRSSNLPNDYDVFFNERLNQIVKDEFNKDERGMYGLGDIQKIISNFSDLSDPYNVSIRAAMTQAFHKYEMTNYLIVFEKSGLISLLDANINREVTDIKSAWESDYIETLRTFNITLDRRIKAGETGMSTDTLDKLRKENTYADLIISPFYIQQLSSKINEAERNKADWKKQVESLNDALKMLGISISNPEKLFRTYTNTSVSGAPGISNFITRFRLAVKALDDVSKTIDTANPEETEENVIQRKYVNIFNNSATSGFVNELLKYQLNDQNEFVTNQFQNAEKRTVYALQLMHSLTNTASSINYYNSSEETLRENLPQLFNRFSGYVENNKFVPTSILLDSVLSVNKKSINIVALNGARDSDNNGKITMTLSPGELLSTRIKHITSGVYLINQAADRKVTNALTVTDDKNNNSVFFQSVSDGLYQFRKYLLNELNAIKNSEGKDIIFYKDHKDKLRFFGGILKDTALDAVNDLLETKENYSFITFDELNAHTYTDANNITHNLRDLVDESVKSFFAKEVEKLYKDGSKAGIFDSTVTQVIWDNGQPTMKHLGKTHKVKIEKGPTGKNQFARKQGVDKLMHSELEEVTTFNFPIGIGHELWSKFKGTNNWTLAENKTSSVWDNTIKQILTSVVFNQAAAYVEQAIMFTGDPAVYKNLADMYKRIAMHNSPKKSTLTGKVINNALSSNPSLTLFKNPTNINEEIQEVGPLTKEEVKDYVKGKYKVPKDHFLKADSGFRVDRYFSDYKYNPDLIKTVVTDDVWSISNLAFDNVTAIELYNNKVIYKDKDNNTINPDQVAPYRKVFTEMFLKLGVKNTVVLQNKVNAYLDPYLKIEESNAIGLITLSEYRSLFMRTGLDWTKKHEKAYVKAISGQLLSNKEFQLFQPIKTQYSGPLHEYLNSEDKTVNGDHTRLNVPTGYKHMLMPLIPSAVKGTYYEKALRHMEGEGIGILQFVSGNKYGTRLQEVIQEDGKIVFKLNQFLASSEKEIKNNFNSWKTQSIYYKYFGIQVDNKPKLKGKQRVSTQGRKTITLNSKNFGESVDPTLEKLVQDYTEVSNSLIYNNWEKFKEELNVFFDSAENESKIGNLEYLIRILLDQEKDRGSNTNTIASIVAMLENPEMKIENTMSPGKVQNVLMALVRNRVLKDKRNGESFAQAPISGFDKVFRNKHSTGKMDRSSELLFYRQGVDGKTIPAQIMIPYPTDWTPWLLNLGNNNLNTGLIRLNELLDNLHKKLHLIRETERPNSLSIEELEKYNLTWDEQNLLNLTTIVGFRIPNQGFSSNEVFEVKKFLPAEHGTLAVLPTEIVAKNGSDFDFDKNNTYIPNWIIDRKTGKPIYIQSDEFTQNDYKRYLRSIKSKLSKHDDFIKSKLSDIKEVNRKVATLISSKNNIFNYLEMLGSSFSEGILDLKESLNELLDPKTQLSLDETQAEIKGFGALINLIYESFEELDDADIKDSDVAAIASLQEVYYFIDELVDLVKNTKPDLLADYDTYVKANSLSFADYKREFRDNPMKYSDTKMLENKVLDLQKDILLHEANYGQLLSPIDDSILKGKNMGEKGDYHPGIVWRVRFLKNINNPEFSDIAEFSKIFENYKSKIKSGEDREKTLNDSITEFIKEFEKKGDSGSLSGALLLSQNLDKFNAFLVGKRNIGAVARHITSLSNTQRANLFVNTPIIINLDQSNGKPYYVDNATIYFEANWVVDLDNSGNVVYFDGNPYRVLVPENEVYENGVFIGYKNDKGVIVAKPNSRIYPSLGGVKTSNNERISDVLSAFLTAYVDVAKDPYIFDMNAGTSTVHVHASMLRLGASLEFTELFMNQPVISTYLQKQAANETLLRKIHDLDVSKEVLFIASLAEHDSSINKLISTKDWYEMSIPQKEEAYIAITGPNKLKTHPDNIKYATNYWKSVAVDYTNSNSKIDPKKQRAFWDNYNTYVSAYKTYAKSKNRSLYKLKANGVANVRKAVFDNETRKIGVGKEMLEYLHTRTEDLDYSNNPTSYGFESNAYLYQTLFKDGKLSVQALEDYLAFGIPENQKSAITFAILDLFLEYQRNGVELNRSMNSVSFDTFGTPKSILGLYNYNMSHTRTANIEHFGNADKMIDETIISPFKTIFQETADLFSKLLFVNPSENFWPGVKELVDKVNTGLPYNEHEDSFNNVIYEFQNFLLHFDFEDGFGKAIDSARIYKELVLGYRNSKNEDNSSEKRGARSLPKMINDIKQGKGLKDPLTELLANNTFIKALSIRDIESVRGMDDFFTRTETDNSRFTNPVLMIFTRKMDPKEINSLILGFREVKNLTKLMNNNHPYKTLYNDLIDFCLACYGVNPNANNSYYQFIPTEDLINKMSLTIQRFKNYTKGLEYASLYESNLKARWFMDDTEQTELFKKQSNRLSNLMYIFHDEFWRRYNNLPKVPKERTVFVEDDEENFSYKEYNAYEWLGRNFQIPYAFRWKPLGDGTFVKSIVRGEIEEDNKGNLKRVYNVRPDHEERPIFIGSKSWVGYNSSNYDKLIEDVEIINEEEMLDQLAQAASGELETFNYMDPSDIKLVTSGQAFGTDRYFVGQLITRGVNANSIIEYTTESYDEASDELKKEMDDKYMAAAVNVLKRNFNSSSTDAGKLLRRNWLQVKPVDNILAVGNILAPGGNSRKKNKETGEHYKNLAGKQVVDGGTGVTVEMAIQAGKNVYVLHEGSLIGNKYNQGWYQWDYKTNTFVKMVKPMTLPDNFAAIGTTKINPFGESGIRTLLNNTLGRPKSDIVNPYPSSFSSTTKQIVDEKTGEAKYPSLGSIALTLIKDKVFENKANTTLRTSQYSYEFFKGDGVYDIQGDPRQVIVKKLGNVSNDNTNGMITLTKVDANKVQMTQDELAVREGFENWEDFKANATFPFAKDFIAGKDKSNLDIYSVKPIIDKYRSGFSGIIRSNAEDGRTVYVGKLKEREDLPSNGVAVFGSNGIGVQDGTRPAGGAASTASKNGWVKNGENMIDKYSENGKSWGLHTILQPGAKSKPEYRRSINEIEQSIKLLYAEARNSPDKDFYVMYNDERGNNGHDPLLFASAFDKESIPENIIFNDRFYNLVLRYRANLADAKKRKDQDFIPISAYDDGPFKHDTYGNPSVRTGQYEITTNGIDPRFSALSAFILKKDKATNINGVTKDVDKLFNIEELYQLNIKGFGEAQDRKSLIALAKAELTNAGAQLNDLNIAQKTSKAIKESLRNGVKSKGKLFTDEKLKRLIDQGKIKDDSNAEVLQYLWNRYLALWEIWAIQNPKLINELAHIIYSSNYTLKLNDQYGFKKNNQARALSNILNRYYGNNPVVVEKNPVKISGSGAPRSIQQVVDVDITEQGIVYGVVPNKLAIDGKYTVSDIQYFPLSRVKYHSPAKDNTNLLEENCNV
jgi:hypothetical protein